MSTDTSLFTKPLHFSLDIIREEVYYLVQRGIIRRRHQLYILREHISPREWLGIECELERHDYLLRDRVEDLIGEEKWQED